MKYLKKNLKFEICHTQTSRHFLKDDVNVKIVWVKQFSETTELNHWIKIILTSYYFLLLKFKHLCLRALILTSKEKLRKISPKREMGVFHGLSISSSPSNQFFHPLSFEFLWTSSLASIIDQTNSPTLQLNGKSFKNFLLQAAENWINGLNSKLRKIWS